MPLMLVFFLVRARSIMSSRAWPGGKINSISNIDNMTRERTCPCRQAGGLCHSTPPVLICRCFGSAPDKSFESFRISRSSASEHETSVNFNFFYDFGSRVRVQAVMWEQRVQFSFDPRTSGLQRLVTSGMSKSCSRCHNSLECFIDWMLP